MAVRAGTHSALVTPTTFTLTGPARAVRVESIDGAARVCFRIDGEEAVLDAEENYSVAAFMGCNRELRTASWPCTISVIASATTQLSIMCVDFEDE